MNFHNLNQQTPNSNTYNHRGTTTVGNNFGFCAEFPQSRAASARKHDFAMIPLFYGEADPYWRCPWNYPSNPQQLLTLDYFQNFQSYSKTRVVILTLPSPFLDKRIEMLSCMDGLGLQLGSSSRAKHGGAYFSAIFGRKFNPTTVLRPCQPLACYWRVGIAAAPTLFTTSAKHHGSRCCGWSDLSLLCTSICDTEMAADTCCLKGVCCATFLYGRVCGCRVDNLGKV